MNIKFTSRFLGIASLAFLASVPFGVSAQNERPLSATARQVFSFDSNVLMLGPNTPIPAIYGSTSRSDVISTTSIGSNYANSFGTQNFSVGADLALVRYNNLSVLDRNTYSISGRLNGDWGPVVYTGMTASLSRLGSTLFAQNGFEPNLISSRQFGANAGFKFNPTWSVFAGGDILNRSNSAVSLASADSQIVGKEMGLRYQPQSGIDGSFVLRQTQTSFDNRQQFDLNGIKLAGSAISNNSQQNQILLRVNYQPTDISSFNGEVGSSSVRFDELSQRNSNVLLWKLSYLYSFSDAIALTTRFSRDNSNLGAAFSSAIVSTNLGLGASWKATGRTSFRANLDYTDRDFKTDAGVAQGVTANRRETFRTVGVGASYELLRNLNLNGSINRVHRGSSIAGNSADGTNVLIGLDLILR